MGVRAQRLSAEQWNALGMLFDHEERLGRRLEAGDAGVYSVTWADAHTVGIHWRTAEALQRRGLVTIEGDPLPEEPSDLFLTETGRYMAGGRYG